jgi:hypothetical protein
MSRSRMSPSPDRIGHRPAGHLARELTALTHRRRALVVLADPTTGAELDRHVVGPPPAGVDGSAVLGLVLPSRPTVCDASRLHEASLRRLLQHWRADRLLVAPCTFGHDLVAVAVVAVAPGADPLLIERAARPLADRFATSVIGTRLLTNPAGRDSLLFAIGA